MFSRLLSDPVWYFYLFWFPKYLMDARAQTLLQVGRVAWIVYLAADLGSVAGGFCSGLLIRKGTAVISARLRIMAMAALLAPIGCLIAAGLPIPMVLALAAVVSFAHLTWQVTMGALIVDLFPKKILGTAFGFNRRGQRTRGHAVHCRHWLARNTSLLSRPSLLAMAALHPLALLLALRVRYLAGKVEFPARAAV